jgi:NADPH:quinone reductase-like Zn-dependent oxidoreductase
VTEGLRLRAPGGFENLVLDKAIPVPSPGPGEIRIALKALSLNYHDYLVILGRLPTADGRIPMSDCAGEVVEVGEGVEMFAPGDLVISLFFPRWLDGRLEGDDFRFVPGDGMDGYARRLVTAPATAFTHAPTGYTHMEGATLPCAGVTAWRALAEGGIKSEDVVLVQGTGGVSIFALQFAKAAGASVIATSSSPEKLERLKALGADHVINHREDSDWGETARKLSGGVDHVVEVGGAGTLNQSISACRNGGHIALIGILAGSSGPISTAKMMAKQIRLTGITVGSRRHQLDMIRAIEACAIRPVIDCAFSLESMVDAFHYQESGRHVGKICVSIE